MKCVNISRSQKGGHKHKYKCGGRSIAHQHHNETRTHANDGSTCLRKLKNVLLQTFVYGEPKHLSGQLKQTGEKQCDYSLF